MGQAQSVEGWFCKVGKIHLVCGEEGGDIVCGEALCGGGGGCGGAQETGVGGGQDGGGVLCYSGGLVSEGGGVGGGGRQHYFRAITEDSLVPRTVGARYQLVQLLAARVNRVEGVRRSGTAQA